MRESGSRMLMISRERMESGGMALLYRKAVVVVPSRERRICVQRGRARGVSWVQLTPRAPATLPSSRRATMPHIAGTDSQSTTSACPLAPISAPESSWNSPPQSPHWKSVPPLPKVPPTNPAMR